MSKINRRPPRRSHARPAESPRIVLGGIDRWGPGGFQLHECGRMADSRKWQHRGLQSPYWRLYHNEKGGGSIEVAGRRLALRPDQVTFIPEGVRFGCRGGAGTPHRWIHFSPPPGFEAFREVARFRPEPALARALAAWSAELLRPGRRSPSRTGEEDRRRIFHACQAVLHLAFGQEAGTLRPREAAPAPLAAVLEAVERSLAEPPGNALLARRAGMGVEGFIRWFKARTGTTPARHVAARRVREASRLLAFGDRSIEEVAAAVGFANRHHFSRVFRRHAGIPPATFRREQRRERGI